MSDGGNKLTLGRFIHKFMSNKMPGDDGYGDGPSREDLLNVIKSPVTKQLLTDEGYKTLEEISKKEDVFTSVSNFDGELTPSDLNYRDDEITMKDITKLMDTTAQRAVTNLIYHYVTFRQGAPEATASPWEFHRGNEFEITKDEINLLKDFVAGKVTLDDLIKKNPNVKSTEEFKFFKEAYVPYENISKLKPEVKEKITEVLSSIETFFGNLDLDHDSKITVEDLLSLGSKDDTPGISVEDIAEHLKDSENKN